MDDEINEIASAFAFPPEVLKAQVFHESASNSRFDPNVVRYEILTIDFRHFTGEFDVHPSFTNPTDQPALETFTLPGGRVVDPNKPPESNPPTTSRSETATASGSNLVLGGCADCAVKVFFGNPGGTDRECVSGDADSCDGPDPVVDELWTAVDPGYEMEFQILFNGDEVPTYLAQEWQHWNGAGVVNHTLPSPVPDGRAVLDPSTGEVTYFGPVSAGDTLEVRYDPVSAITSSGVYPLGNLVESTGILDLLNQAYKEAPYWYPPAVGYHLTFGDLLALWYPMVGSPRSLLSGTASEARWRLGPDGRPLDPKFNVETQYIWGHAMGATQFQISQMVTETWGRGVRTISDASGVVFDLFDSSKSLPMLLQDFRVNLHLLRATHIAKGIETSYPCADVGRGAECSDAQWQLFVSDALRKYNGTGAGISSPYPDAVYSHLTSADTNIGAFGGNVSYQDPVVP